MASLDQLTAQLDRLAAFDAGPFPVVSLYLNLQPDQHGRDSFEAFIRKELAGRVRTYAAAGPERESLERDAERIRTHLGTVAESSNGLAIFACSGADLFEAVELAAPIEAHRLYVSDAPHLYPLARLLDQFPRYAAVVADTHEARVFVFASNTVQRQEEVEGKQTRRHKVGGWSQARYQRHIENDHQQHVKEVIDVLARLVRDEAVPSIVLAGDDVVIPLLRGAMPKDVAERVVDVLKLDIRAADREVLDATLAAIREQDAGTDRERVEAMFGAYRSGSLATVGAEAVEQALDLGQVDELLLAARPEAIAEPVEEALAAGPDRSEQEKTADRLVAKARQTGATVRFIEDAELLKDVGGVAALLRFAL